MSIDFVSKLVYGIYYKKLDIPYTELDELTLDTDFRLQEYNDDYILVVESSEIEAEYKAVRLDNGIPVDVDWGYKLANFCENHNLTFHTPTYYFIKYI
jgi:hypothetical protein